MPQLSCIPKRYPFHLIQYSALLETDTMNASAMDIVPDEMSPQESTIQQLSAEMEDCNPTKQESFDEIDCMSTIQELLNKMDCDSTVPAAKPHGMPLWFINWRKANIKAQPEKRHAHPDTWSRSNATVTGRIQKTPRKHAPRKPYKNTMEVTMSDVSNSIATCSKCSLLGLTQLTPYSMDLRHWSSMNLDSPLSST